MAKPANGALALVHDLHSQQCCSCACCRLCSGEVSATDSSASSEILVLLSQWLQLRLVDGLAYLRTAGWAGSPSPRRIGRECHVMGGAVQVHQINKLAPCCSLTCTVVAFFGRIGCRIKYVLDAIAFGRICTRGEGRAISAGPGSCVCLRRSLPAGNQALPLQVSDRPELPWRCIGREGDWKLRKFRLWSLKFCDGREFVCAAGSAATVKHGDSRTVKYDADWHLSMREKAS